MVLVEALRLLQDGEAPADDDAMEDVPPETATASLYRLTSHHWRGDFEVQLAAFLLTFLTILLGATILGHYVRDVWKFLYLPEAGAILLVGIIGGAIFTLSKDTAITDTIDDFDPAVFFVAFLPPIIFNSGYHLQQGAFISNVGAILAFAFLGTALSTILMTLMLWGASEAGGGFGMSLAELLTMSSLLSATDPVSTLAVLAKLNVDPNLFYVIFGESVFNDAAALVLFNTLSKFVGYTHDAEIIWIAIADFVLVFVSSTLIGIVFGLGSALLFRRLEVQEPLVEATILLLLVYIPFLFATMLGMSGIVAILFMGIFSRRYVTPSLTRTTQRLADHFSRVLAYVAEAAVFLNLGLSVVSTESRAEFKNGLVFVTLLACLVSRLVHVVLISGLVNFVRKRRCSTTRLLRRNDMFLICFAGLRGAVAYAAAALFPDANGNRDAVKAVTMMIVIVTTFVMGGLTEQMCYWLKIPTNMPEAPVIMELQGEAARRGGLQAFLASVERSVINPILGETDAAEASSPVSLSPRPPHEPMVKSPMRSGVREVEDALEEGKEQSGASLPPTPTSARRPSLGIPSSPGSLDYGRRS